MQLLPRSNSVVSYAAQQIRPVLILHHPLLCFAPHYSLKQRFSQCGSDDLTITVNTTRRVPAQHKTAVTYCVCECWSISLTRWWLGNLLWCLGFKFAIVCERWGGVRLREGRAVSLCCRACRINGCTHLAVFLVLAPHLFAEAPGCLAGSVWGDDVVVDQSWQVSPHCGQVSTVCQPWRAHVHNSRVRMRRRLAPISLWNRFHRFFHICHTCMFYIIKLSFKIRQ